jgi:hypothetical protein
MNYHEYLRAFLKLEDRLLALLQEIPYDAKSKDIYSESINLPLLAACPVIESYLTGQAVHSPTVQSHPLWNWQYAWKLWDKKDKQEEVKTDKNGNRIMTGTFPKFTYVAEEVYGISRQTVSLYRYDRVKRLSNQEDSVVTLRPFASFGSVVRYQNYDGTSGYPTGYRTPSWWTAYNKIKHDMGLAKKYVTYQSVVEAIGGLFLVLSHCDPDRPILSRNGFLSENNESVVIESRAYTCEVIA